VPRGGGRTCQCDCGCVQQPGPPSWGNARCFTTTPMQEDIISPAFRAYAVAKAKEDNDRMAAGRSELRQAVPLGRKVQRRRVWMTQAVGAKAKRSCEMRPRRAAGFRAHMSDSPVRCASPGGLCEEGPAGGWLPPSEGGRCFLPIPMVPVPNRPVRAQHRGAQQLVTKAQRHAQNVNEALSTLSWLYGVVDPDCPEGGPRNPTQVEVVEHVDGL
jgi:hypothetical protein